MSNERKIDLAEHAHFRERTREKGRKRERERERKENDWMRSVTDNNSPID